MADEASEELLGLQVVQDDLVLTEDPLRGEEPAAAREGARVAAATTSARELEKLLSTVCLDQAVVLVSPVGDGEVREARVTREAHSADAALVGHWRLGDRLEARESVRADDAVQPGGA